MAEIFISYAKEERHLTAQLAAQLTSAAYSVWWDTELLAGHKFREVIDRELRDCMAAIIVWSPISINSDWVRSEADEAYRSGKLINTISGGLSPYNIPKPLNQMHAVSLDDLDAILKAVGRLVGPKVPFHSGVPERLFPQTSEAQFLVDASNAIRRQAQQLLTVSTTSEWETDALQADRLAAGAELLEEALTAFLDGLPLNGIKSFQYRLWLNRLERTARDVRPRLTKEQNWLRGRPTRPVVRGACGELAWVAEELIKVSQPDLA